MIKYVIILLFISLFFLSSIFAGHGGLEPINQLVYELGFPWKSWQAYYAVFRVWKYHLKGAPSQVMGELLLTLLKGANTPAAKITVINGLFRHWIPKAEKPIKTCTHPSIVGISEHFMIICKK